ncbi:hypothetical protein CAI16_17730 [Virgibacillus dokdonensis]|uniref:Xylose isomerase-like TIM barrel domain-containing protein n=1 Tax=Virgibacillus dokdonensis TaxID=302167 RepID=A0A3E0WI94_9BACI|nr:TIM barrel protein [Virgibacillus dokdonensis]RFA32498.1 hypothetical protein CAI16_17730 [Virgibacillus dokdonensis]
MYHYGISGSTILTNSSKLNELFTYDFVDHIEIGEFSDQTAFEKFKSLKDRHGFSFGLHSPLYRTGSKYDLLQYVNIEPEVAWSQFEEEINWMSKLGAKYVLVHFPYFKSKVEEKMMVKMESGLRRLQHLQLKYDIPIVCEPKLGFNRSPANIELLHHFSVERWSKYDIKLCIDIGDYLLGAKGKALSYISKWKEHIKVVHLHHVACKGKKYFWLPIHPTQEEGQKYLKVQHVIKELAGMNGIYFILEHTPHFTPSKQFVQEGIAWLHSLLEKPNHR